MHTKKFLTSAFLCVAVIAGYASNAYAQDDFDENDPIWINNVPPMSYWGLRGLPQTVAAEPLGKGRLNFSILGSYFKQEQDLTGLRGTVYNPLSEDSMTAISGGPKKGSGISTMRLGASWGLNNIVDVFGSLPFFYLFHKDNDKNLFRLGELMGGIQVAMPIPEEIPLKVAAQMRLIYGLAEVKDDPYNVGVTNNPEYLNGLNPYHTYAGFEYGEARKKDLMDLVLTVPVSMVAGNLRRAVKLHLNPGVGITPGKDGAEDWLFLWGAGVEIDPTEFMTIGAEIHGRTPLTTANFPEDPLWVTPSLMFRSPYYSEGLFGIAFVAGADFRLSKSKPTRSFDIETNVNKGLDVYPIEKWRGFADLVFSFDLLASQRAAMIREARANAAEKARLRKQAELTAAQKDSIARKAQEDSLRLVSEMASRAHADSLRAKAMADSLSEKARQDSIAQAQAAASAAAQQASASAQREAALKAEAEQKRIADSIALAEVNRRLADERSKRSDAEQMMLSTGMIVLDAVEFESGRTVLHRNSRPYLTIIAKMLSKYPKLKIEIGGHTDITGSFEKNMSLSQERAQAVAMFMISAEPSLGTMLAPKGYGPTVPKADNRTKEGQAINRRVELRVLNPEVLKEYNP